MAGTALRNLPANEEKALRSMRENCISREKRYKEELQRLQRIIHIFPILELQELIQDRK